MPLDRDEIQGSHARLEVSIDGMRKRYEYKDPIDLIKELIQNVWGEIPLVSPNPPKDTAGRREDSGGGVRELQGR